MKRQGKNGEVKAKILTLLKERSMRNGEIIEALDISQSNASYHLNFLEKMGCVLIEPISGTKNLYSFLKDMPEGWRKTSAPIVNKVEFTPSEPKFESAFLKKMFGINEHKPKGGRLIAETNIPIPPRKPEFRGIPSVMGGVW